MFDLYVIKMSETQTLSVIAFALILTSDVYFQSVKGEESFNPSREGCLGEEHREGDLRLIHSRSPNEGVLQLCVTLTYYNGSTGREWIYFNPTHWSEKATRLACGELGQSSNWAQWDAVKLTSETFTLEMQSCDCNKNSVYNCTANSLSFRDKVVVRVNCSEHLTTTTASSPTSALSSSSAGLAVVTTLLALALAITSTGWIISCVYIKKTITVRQPTTKTVRASNQQLGSASLQRHLENPVYDGSTSTPAAEHSTSAATYSEVSPNSYDVIAARSHDTGNGSHDYNVLERTANNQNSESGGYHVLEHGPGSHDSHEAGEYEVPTTGLQQYSTLNH